MLRTNNGYSRRFMICLIAVVLAMTVLSGCGKKKSAAGDTEVVATYKDGKVTKTEFESYVGSTKFFYPMYQQFEGDPAFQEHILKQLVAFRLLSAKADDQVKKDAETKTKEQMDEIKKYFDGQGKDALDKQLKELKISQDDLKTYIQTSLVVLNDAEKKITDDQIKSKYDEKAKTQAYDVATVSHILIALKDPETDKEIRTKDEALKRAKEVKDKLDKGGDFAALAKEYSDDPGSKENGGKYTDAEVSQWVEGFKKAALELPLNTISDPVETEFGYHIMKVESRKTKTLDEVKNDLKGELAETQIMDFMQKELPNYELKIEKLPQPEQPAPNTSAPAPAPAPAQPDQQQPAGEQKK